MFTNLLTYSLSSAVFIPPSAATQPLHSLRKTSSDLESTAMPFQTPVGESWADRHHGRTDTMGTMDGQTPWAPWADRHHGRTDTMGTMGGQTPWAPWVDRHHGRTDTMGTMGGQTPWADIQPTAAKTGGGGRLDESSLIRLHWLSQLRRPVDERSLATCVWARFPDESPHYAWTTYTDLICYVGFVFGSNKSHRTDD